MLAPAAADMWLVHLLGRGGIERTPLASELGRDAEMACAGSRLVALYRVLHLWGVVILEADDERIFETEAEAIRSWLAAVDLDIDEAGVALPELWAERG